MSKLIIMRRDEAGAAAIEFAIGYGQDLDS